MTDALIIALAQLNPTVGDVVGNAARLRGAREEAARLGADLVVASELALSGYPPEDLVVRPSFQETVHRELAALAAETVDGGPGILVGTPWVDDGTVYNVAALLDGGRIADVRRKYDLPNYGVFDEKRVFARGPLPGPVNFRGVRLGVMICEDMWTDEVTECLEESGAEILVVLNGSPFEVDKVDQRLNLAVARVTESRLPIVYVNQVGGQDELVFDGSSFVLDADAALKGQAVSWREEILPTTWRRENGAWHCEAAERNPPAEGLAAIYEAMTLGLRDYVTK
ncbi:MAG: NAD+ synthase, partial [Defluviicoccus sp.]|nr:NAD+ synthase [Defluviicoccus sp.]